MKIKLSERNKMNHCYISCILKNYVYLFYFNFFLYLCIIQFIYILHFKDKF